MHKLRHVSIFSVSAIKLMTDMPRILYACVTRVTWLVLTNLVLSLPSLFQQWHQYDFSHHSTQRPDLASSEDVGGRVRYGVKYQKSSQQIIRARCNHIRTTAAKTLQQR